MKLSSVALSSVVLFAIGIGFFFFNPAGNDRSISASDSSAPVTGATPPASTEGKMEKETDSETAPQPAVTLVTKNDGSSASSNGSHFFPVERRPAPEPSETPVTSPLLAPRREVPKEPLVIPKGKDLEITVKFRDSLLARAQPGGAVSIVTGANDTLSKTALPSPVAFRPAFDARSAGKLRDLQQRAAEGSGTRQPDFEGTLIVTLAGKTSREERIEVARVLHQLEEVEYVELAALDNLPPPPGDISPPTPDITSFQTYRNSEAASGGVDVAYAFSRGIRGQGIRVSDCEYGFNASHEDLVDSDITDSSRGPFHANVTTNGWDKHGTAAIGISGATENGYGVTGIAAAAEIHFYSEWTTNGARRRESVTDAIADSGFGDVVLLEMQTGDGQGSYVPAEYSATIWNLIKAGSDAGVIVVAAAGNGSADLDDEYFDPYHARGDSGSIIIGAGNQNATHTRKGFSTYGDRVDVQAWGGGVYSTGYGSYATYGGDVNQRYTSGFNGTSSASAIAAPSVAVIQSFCEQILGYRLGPIQMRSLVEGTGVHPATEQKIGPHINIRNAILFFAPVTNLTCTQDLSDRVVASWAGTPNATDYQVYRGETTDPGDAVLLGTSQGQLQWSDTTIPPGASRNYFVRPVTIYGPGEWSAPVAGTSVGFPIDLTDATDTGSSSTDDITRNRTPGISGVSAPNTGLTITSNLDGVVGTALADGSGAWTTTLNELTEGVHRLVAAEDGGRSSVPLEVVIDVTDPDPPTLLALHSEDDSGILDNDGITRITSPRFVGQTNGPAEVFIYLDDIFYQQVQSDGSFSAQATELADGNFQLSARSRDLAGNESQSFEGSAFTIDTAAPMGAIQRAPDQSISIPPGPIDFEIVFQEAVAGLSRSDFAIGGTSPDATLLMGQGPVIFSVRVTGASAEGPVFLSISEGSFTDLAGNPGPSISGAASTVYVDFEGNSNLELDAAGNGATQAWLSQGDQDHFQFEVDQSRHLSIVIEEFGDLIESIRNLDGVEFFNRSELQGGSGTQLDFALPKGTYVIKLSDPSGQNSGVYDLVIEGGEDTASKPDCRVGKSMSSSRGNDIYSTPAGQTYTLNSKKARTVRGLMAVENDGDFLDSFRIGGSRGNRLFRLSYSSEGQNITAALLVFQHSTDWIQPGGPAASVSTTVKPSRRRLIRKTSKGRKKYLRKSLRLSFIAVGLENGSDRSGFIVKTR